MVTAALWGPQDAHRRLLERRLKVKLSARGRQITLTGRPDHLPFAERAIRELVSLARGGQTLFLNDIEQVVNLIEGAPGEVNVGELRTHTLTLTHDRRAVGPKSPNQKAYIEAMRDHDIVFSVGPAGTGKTYLAMAAAVAALRAQEVKRIILARPAVEAGERLGFLPGSLVEKVNPYLRPLHDALYDLMGIETATRLIENGTVEVAPLAFMRGRTLNQAFVILDEAQNTTREQMKMFLTRLGYSSRAVVTGDTTQVDLERGRESGLSHALEILDGIEGIAIVRLTPVDVVRHALVQAIVRAYDRDDAHNEAAAEARGEGRDDRRDDRDSRGGRGRGGRG
ncbi:MAG: PhoH family protein [Myxococcales bacterium]|nr:PhoH family protein [Myxococcales bacterium]